MGIRAARRGATLARRRTVVQATAYLPFNMPSRATLAGSSKKVWYHWMGGTFPISVDNKNAVSDPTEYWRQDMSYYGKSSLR